MPRVSRNEWTAFACAALIGTMVVYGLVASMGDAARRFHEGPLRAVFGDGTFEQLESGRQQPLHYIGSDRTAPDFTLNDRQGHPYTLSEHRGHVVVLNFWTITCGPCVEEMPKLDQLAQLVGPWEDVEVVGVSIDSGWDEVARIMPPNPHINYLFDPTNSVVGPEYGSNLFPETWIIDKDGVIRFRYDGGFDWSQPVVLNLIDSYR